MKISYGADLRNYKKADCKQFRPPIIDSTKILSIIEERFLDAFRRGYSLDSVRKSLLTDESVISQVKSQLEDHFSFKRDVESSRVENLAQARLEAKTSQYEKQKKEIEDTYNAQVAALHEDQTQKGMAYVQQQELYSQAQNSLKELRDNIFSAREVLNTTGNIDLEKITQYMTDDSLIEGAAGSIDDAVAYAPKKKKNKEKKGFFKKIKSYFRRKK